MKYVITVILAIFSITTFANLPPGEWQCTAFDKRESSFTAFGETLKETLAKARQLCIRKSNQGCRTAESFCQQGSFIENRCLVTDNEGHSWNTTGPDACDNGLALCRQWQFLRGTAQRGICNVKHF